MGSNACPPSKRARLAFDDDVPMVDAPEPEYQKWRDWRRDTYPIAVAFMSPEDRGAAAAAYHNRLLAAGLDLRGVDRVVAWADPDTVEAPDTLLAIALFEK